VVRWSFDVELGSREHYLDPLLYEHGYKRRRADVHYYRDLALHSGGRGPVLELGCGSGRISLSLARVGVDVVGVDRAASMLAFARSRADRLPRRSGSLQLVQADLRSFAFSRRFSLIIAPFNTLMHLYESSDMARALDCVRAHLEPGGTFAFDVLNPDLPFLARPPGRRYARTRFKHPRTGEWWIYSESVFYDAVRQVAFIRFYYEREGRSRLRIVRLAHRQFFPVELEELLDRAGFVIKRRDGDFAGGSFASDSVSQVIQAVAGGASI
jgi:SAM-dependent methyltransferase